MYITLFVFILALFVMIWLYSLYTRLIVKRNNALEALSGIDVQLMKRHELIPNILTIAKKFAELQNMLTDCMMGIAVDNNDNAFVLGVSELYRNESVPERSQTFLNVGTMEGGTGSAFDDTNGITVNLTCTQYELPREYTGNISYYTDANPSTTFAATTT